MPSTCFSEVTEAIPSYLAGQLEKQGMGNGTGTGTGTGICTKSCTGRDETIACTDLVHNHLWGQLEAHCDLVHELRQHSQHCGI